MMSKKESSISPFMNYISSKETVLVSDGYDSNEIDLNGPPLNLEKRPTFKERLNKVYLEETEDQENQEDKIFYSIDGDKLFISGILFSCSKKTEDGKDFIEVGFRPDKYSEKKLAVLIKSFIFDNDKNCMVHNLKVLNTFMFENEDGLDIEYSNFKWILKEIDYCDGLLTIQLTNSLA